MNNYPVWWNSDITVYNKNVDEQTHVISWYFTHLSNCFYKNVGERVQINDVSVDTNNIICRIPKQSTYKTPYEWTALPNDEKAQYFTLKPGDIIVYGSVDDTIDEYTSGSRSSDLLKKYKALQGCLTVQEVADNTGTGRGDEHYRVNGI